MNKEKRVIIVGGGLAGLSAAMKCAASHVHVDLVSISPAKRAHSVCAQGGINAAMNTHGEDDSPLIHAYDTIKGGDFLADQPPVVEMCMAAPSIIHFFDRAGCPFTRTSEGNLDVRRFGGTLYHRTVFCGASTGQQLMYTLDEQVRRFETLNKVTRWEHHEFIRVITDENNNTRGVVVMDVNSMELLVIKADIVIMATGGLGYIFKQSTNSTSCTGAAIGRLFMQGVQYANGEFIQIHPTAIPGLDKLRLISESVRGEGGRVWVNGDSSKSILTPSGKRITCGVDGQPWYFLEEMYPAYGNLVPRDIGAREILRICEMGMGIDGGNQVYLDVRHLSPDTWKKLGAVLDIYRKFTGEDPTTTPMRIFPAVHYSMGGAWVDWPASDDKDRWERYRQMTTIPGLFCAGECEFQYHGANRLGANSLLSCIYGGLVAGKEAVRYVETHASQLDKKPSESIFKEGLEQEAAFKRQLLTSNGSENIHQLHNELSAAVVQHVTVKRDNQNLLHTIDVIKQIRERYNNVGLDDRSTLANRSYLFASQFKSLLELSLVMTKGAYLRNEFRGAHFKPEYPKRDDSNWLKTTIATYKADEDEPEITYRDVDTRHLKPVMRDYTKAATVKPTFENLPQSIEPPL